MTDDVQFPALAGKLERLEWLLTAPLRKTNGNLHDDPARERRGDIEAQERDIDAYLEFTLRDHETHLAYLADPASFPVRGWAQW